MIKPNTIWLSKKNVMFRLLAVIPDDEGYNPNSLNQMTCYAAQCYAKHDDGSDGTGFDSVALPMQEWIANYFLCPQAPPQ